MVLFMYNDTHGDTNKQLTTSLRNSAFVLQIHQRLYPHGYTLQSLQSDSSFYVRKKKEKPDEPILICRGGA